MSDEPAKSDGRDAQGRFLKGQYKGGPGNPNLRRSGALRQALAKAVTPATMKRIMVKLVAKAESGNLPAIKELLDRLFGRPQQASSYVAGGGLDFTSLRTPDDVIRAGEQLAKAVSDGTITPEDSKGVTVLLEFVRRSIETGDLAKKLDELRKLVEGQHQ